MVILPLLSSPVSSGRYVVTLSSNLRRPSSTSFRTQGVVATTLVREAASKMVSEGHRLALRNGAPFPEGLPVSLPVSLDPEDSPRKLLPLDGAGDRRVHLPPDCSAETHRWSLRPPDRIEARVERRAKRETQRMEAIRENEVRLPVLSAERSFVGNEEPPALEKRHHLGRTARGCRCAGSANSRSLR